jgi:serine/threonine protein kinase
MGHHVPKIINQAAEGLAHFNSLGWVHCDVKPDNFLVTDDGVVKLIDFALAKRSRSGLGRLFAMKSKVQGTMSYMAPEQIRGGALDIRTDVYAFACLLHELLSGKPPFTGSSPNELLAKHIKTPPPSLEAHNKNVTPEFAQLVRQALSKNPAKRPKSVDEFRLHKVFKIPPRPPKDKDTVGTGE